MRNSTTILTKEFVDALPNGWQDYAWHRINKGVLLYVLTFDSFVKDALGLDKLLLKDGKL